MSLSIDVLPNSGMPQADMGEGSGVMSTNGPTPGEDKADAGESESDLRALESRTERILELRTGRPALKTVCCGVSIAEIASAEVAVLAGRSCSSSWAVCNRRPALTGVGARGDAIVGYAFEAAMSRGWREASYWNDGVLLRLWVRSKEGELVVEL